MTTLSYDQTALIDELIRDEGVRLSPYRDSLGYWTIGVGHLLVGSERRKFVSAGQAIRQIDAAECKQLLLEDIWTAESNLTDFYPDWRQLDDVRQRALLNLSFNLGPRLLQFRRLRAACQSRDWKLAKASLENSLWYQQVKRRGPRIVHMITTGTPWAKS